MRVLFSYLRHFAPFWCHFLVITRLGFGRPPICSVVHVFLIVKSGKAFCTGDGQPQGHLPLRLDWLGILAL